MFCLCKALLKVYVAVQQSRLAALSKFALSKFNLLRQSTAYSAGQ